MSRPNTPHMLKTLTREQAFPLTSLVAAVCAIVMVLLSGMPGGGQVIVAALILCGILFRVGACVHFSLIITLILRGLPAGPDQQLYFGIADVLFALATVGYVACVFRSLELDKRRIEDQTTAAQQHREHAPEPNTTADGHEPTSILRPLKGLPIPIIAASGLAIALLISVPLRMLSPNEFQLTPQGLRAVIILWILTAAGAAVGMWCSTRAWRRLSYGQVELLMRRTVHEELKRELSPLEMQRSRRLWRLYRNRVQNQSSPDRG